MLSQEQFFNSKGSKILHCLYIDAYLLSQKNIVASVGKVHIVLIKGTFFSLKEKLLKRKPRNAARCTNPHEQFRFAFRATEKCNSVEKCLPN